MALVVPPPSKAKFFQFPLIYRPKSPAITLKQKHKRFIHNCFRDGKRGYIKRVLPIVGAASVPLRGDGKDSGLGKILLSDVVVERRRKVYWGRKWNSIDVATVGVVLAMHLLCVFAPFTFNWSALCVALGLYVITGLLGITLSFHRNLSHRSFKLPKWLEYTFAYCGVLALQVWLF